MQTTLALRTDRRRTVNAADLETCLSYLGRVGEWLEFRRVDGSVLRAHASEVLSMDQHVETRRIAA